MPLSEQEELELLRLKKQKAQSEKPSQAAAFGKSAFESLGGAAGGLAGAEAGIAGGAALGALTGPFAPVAAPVLGLTGGLIGGVVGGFGGSKLQEKAGEYVPASIKETTGFGKKQRAEETKEYPITSTIGEFAPSVAAGGKAIYDIGKLGYRSAKELASSLLGKKAAAEQSRLATQAEEAAQAGKQVLTAEQRAAEQATKAEQKALAQRGLSEEQRVAQAAKAGEKAESAGGRTLKELAGVKTLPEAGAFKPIPQTPSEVGNYIRQQAENFVKGIKTQRSAAADANFTAAKTAAQQKEYLGQFVDTSPLVKQIDSLISKGGSSDYLRSLTQVKDDLIRTKSFEGLEVIRRRLGDAAFGLPEEGYKAIGQGFAKDMYGLLADQMKGYSKEFAKYLNDYKRLSQPIEVYGTKIGKGLTETQDAAGKYYAKTAEQVAEDIFSSPEKFKQFVDAVGGNRQIADAAARRYFAGLAEKANTSEKVESLLRDNRALLNEIPAIRQEITSRFLQPLKQAERRVVAAKTIETTSKEIVKDLPKLIKDTDKALADKLKNIKGSETIFSDAVKTLSNSKPGKAASSFDTVVLPRIREAEQKAGIKILDEAKIDALRQQVLQLDRVQNKIEKQILAAKISAAVLGLGTAYAVGTKTVQVLGGQ